MTSMQAWARGPNGPSNWSIDKLSAKKTKHFCTEDDLDVQKPDKLCRRKIYATMTTLIDRKLVVHNKDKLAVEKTTLPYKASNDHKTALMYRKQNFCRYDNLDVQKIAFLKWKK